VDCGQGLRWWLIGAWPHSHSGARELTGGGATERGGHRDIDSGLTVVRVAMSRPGDDGEETAEEVLGVGSA
jgi:hypothetical protein